MFYAKGTEWLIWLNRTRHPVGHALSVDGAVRTTLLTLELKHTGLIFLSTLLFLLPLFKNTPFHSLLPPWSKHLLKAHGLPSIILIHAADRSRLVFNFLSSPLSSHAFPNTHWSTCEHVGPKIYIMIGKEVSPRTQAWTSPD